MKKYKQGFYVKKKFALACPKIIHIACNSLYPLQTHLLFFVICLPYGIGAKRVIPIGLFGICL
jgi:hypothetical protein